MDAKQTILVVDDNPDNISLLTNALFPYYKVKAANNGAAALRIAAASVPDLILLDVMMPDMDGYQVCARLKADPRSREIPVIFVSALGDIEDERQGFAAGGVDYLAKPVSPPLVQARVATHLKLYNQNRELERKVAARTAELENSRLEIVRRLGLAAEFKDNETGTHVIRMSFVARLIAEGIGLGEAEADLVLNAAPMHDVGKIGIPDSILRKPGPLDGEERRVMQRHAEFGAKIIGDHEDPLLAAAKAAALTHHERWDGAGYPQGLAGEAIPRIGRIVAIADVFDALTSERVYKGAWTMDQAIDYINEQAENHFDPEMVRAFIRQKAKIIEIHARYAD